MENAADSPPIFFPIFLEDGAVNKAKFKWQLATRDKGQQATEEKRAQSQMAVFFFGEQGI